MVIKNVLFLLFTILTMVGCSSGSKLAHQSNIVGTWQFNPNRADAVWEQNECSIKSGMRFDKNLTKESRSYANKDGQCILTTKNSDKYSVDGNILTFIYPKMASDGKDLLMSFKILSLDADKLKIVTYSEKDGDKATNVFRSKDNLIDEYIRVKE